MFRGLRRLASGLVVPRILVLRPGPPEHDHLTHLRVACYNPDGSLAWKEPFNAWDDPVTGWMENRLFNEGEIIALDTLYRAVAFPSAYLYGRLYNVTPTDTDTLGTLTGEPSQGVNNYRPIAWTRGGADFAAPAIVGGQGETMGVKKTYTATGGSIGPVTAFVFATTPNNEGKAWGWFMLSQARTIPDGGSLDVQPKGVARGVTS